MTRTPDPIQELITTARRKQILDAATQVFAEKGFHRATIKDIRVSLEMGMIAFFVFAVLSLLAVYLADPLIYAQSLSLTSSPADRYPVQVTLFLLGILAMVALLIFGIARKFRWLFWLILVAFTASVIQIPVEGLQLLGVFPNPYPVWYSLFRGGVGFIELGFAFWMIQTYRHQGVWAMGRKKAEPYSPGSTFCL